MRLKRFNAQKESKRLQNYHNKSNNIKKRTILLSAFILVGSIMLLTYASFSSSIKVDVMQSKVGNLVQDDYEIKAYINNTLSNDIPEKEDGYTVDHVNCTNDAVGIWDDVKWGILITEAEEPTVCSVYFEEYDEETEFDYTGNVQTFTAPRTGTYKLETWGAQGGNNYDTVQPPAYGGYGGYATGTINVSKGTILYVFVGEQGKTTYNNSTITPDIEVKAYPNGGSVRSRRDNHSISFNGGGGSTHIAMQNKLIEELNQRDENLLMVAAGGGGVANWWGDYGDAGSGGGFIGNSTIDNFDHINTTGGTQTNGGLGGGNSTINNYAGRFGVGGGSFFANTNCVSGGGGGGYFGGGASWGGSGAGGSGYIANDMLSNKYMTCYNCETSNEPLTKTNTTTCHNQNPTIDCAKEGNGYAKITLLNLE